MRVDFYYNASENNVINKHITKIKTSECIIKADIDVKKPILELVFDADLHKANYVYIESMNRYYYISDKQNVVGNRFRVYCNVDVLESFKNDILKCFADTSLKQSEFYAKVVLSILAISKTGYC